MAHTSEVAPGPLSKMPPTIPPPAMPTFQAVTAPRTRTASAKSVRWLIPGGAEGFFPRDGGWASVRPSAQRTLSGFGGIMRNRVVPVLAVAACLATLVTGCDAGTTVSLSVGFIKGFSSVFQTPEARSEAQLTGLLKYAPETGDRSFTVIPSKSIRAVLDQVEEIAGEVTSTPKDCVHVALTSVLDLPEGGVMVAGTSGTAEEPGPVGVSILTGLAMEELERALNAKTELVARCPSTVLSTQDGPVTVDAQRMSITARTPEAKSVRTLITYPDGRTQTTVFVTAIQRNVLIATQVTGVTLTESEMQDAGAMLDRVADHIG